MPSAGAGSPGFAATLSRRSLLLPRARRPTGGGDVASEAVTRQRGDPALPRRPHEFHVRLESANHDSAATVAPQRRFPQRTAPRRVDLRGRPQRLPSVPFRSSAGASDTLLAASRGVNTTPRPALPSCARADAAPTSSVSTRVTSAMRGRGISFLSIRRSTGARLSPAMTRPCQGRELRIPSVAGAVSHAVSSRSEPRRASTRDAHRKASTVRAARSMLDR